MPVTKNGEKLQKYSAPALEKGLDILEFLSLVDFKPTLSEVASGIERSKSEIFRMMIVLEERGYIERFDGDTYTLTERMALIGTPRSFNGRLAEISAPYLQQLSDQTGLSNHLSVLDEGQMLVIANTDASTSYGLSLQVGFRSKLTGSGTAASLLYDRLERGYGDLSKDESEQLGKFMEHFNKHGYILSPNPEVHSVLEISAPVCVSEPLFPVAAITLAFLDTAALRNTEPDIADSLKFAVAALGRKLDIAMPSLAHSVVHS